MQADAFKTPDAVCWPTAATQENANLTRFMRALREGSFAALHEPASADPAELNDELTQFLAYRFEQPYAQLSDQSAGLPFSRCRVGGTTNLVLNCIDRWRDILHSRFNKVAP